MAVTRISLTAIEVQKFLSAPTGGTYCRIAPESPDVVFNPFWLADTPTNRAFLKTWLCRLVQRDDETSLPDTVQAQLARCVDYAYESLAKEHRNLTTVTKLLGIDFPRWDRLNQWLRSDGTRSAGEYAYLFDHDTDALDLDSARVGFDFTELMDQPRRGDDRRWDGFNAPH